MLPEQDQARAETLFSYLEQDITGIVSPSKNAPWDQYHLVFEHNRYHGIFRDEAQWLALYPNGWGAAMAIFSFGLKPKGIIHGKQMQGKLGWKGPPFPKNWPREFYNALIALSRESGYLELRMPLAEDHQYYEEPFQLKARSSAEYRAAMRYYYNHVPKKMGFTLDRFTREWVYPLQSSPGI
jgi:hypothetical protein